jgi:hypothetical protein
MIEKMEADMRNKDGGPNNTYACSGKAKVDHPRKKVHQKSWRFVYLCLIPFRRN